MGEVKETEAASVRGERRGPEQGGLEGALARAGRPALGRLQAVLTAQQCPSPARRRLALRPLPTPAPPLPARASLPRTQTYPHPPRPLSTPPPRLRRLMKPSQGRRGD